VPFGTGKAVRDYLESVVPGHLPVAAFLDLKVLIDQVPARYRADISSSKQLERDLPDALRGYCTDNRLHAALAGNPRQHRSEAALSEAVLQMVQTRFRL